MSSTLFKTLIAGAVAAGALLLPGTAAQAAVNHRPCDGPGFGDGAFFGDRMGFPDDGFGSFGDGFGSFGDGFGSVDGGFGFHRHQSRHDRPTVIVVTVNKNHHKKTHHAKPHHHKPAPDNNTTPADNTTTPSTTAPGAGYGTPAPADTTTGYRKNAPTA
jgi:hypothetical protein